MLNFYLLMFIISVVEVQRTRADGNIVKVTEYDLSKDKFDAHISDAVRTHSEKVPDIDRQSKLPSDVYSRDRSPSSPAVRER